MLNINYKVTNLIIVVIFISLLLSFFNKPPIYPLFVFLVIFLLIVCLPFFLEKKTVILNIQFYLILIALYFLYSAIIISQIPISYMINYEFFRHDGNYFISFMPLIILPFLKHIKFDINFNKLVIVFITLVSFITFWAILLIILNNFSCEGRFKVCHFFFKSHNAAGGYYMIVTLLSFFYWRYYKKKMIFFLFFLINFIALVMTDSRGSLIAFLLAMIYYVLEKKHRYVTKNAFTIFISMILLYIYYIGYISSDNLNFNFQREGTVLDRIFNLWPRAIQDFFYSPIVGIGYTRYDDLPYNFEGIKYLYYINITDFIRHTDAHAHNSFLHILAETGIIGLTLWVLLFNSIFKYAKKVFFESKYNYYFIKYGLVAIIFSGFTEHRWTTPAEILPYTIYLSLFIILRKGNEKNIIYK